MRLELGNLALYIGRRMNKINGGVTTSNSAERLWHSHAVFRDNKDRAVAELTTKKE